MLARLAHAIAQVQIERVSRSLSLTNARSIAPDAFRQWVVSGTLLAIVGYFTFSVLNLKVYGIHAGDTQRNVLLTVINVLSLVVTRRWSPVVGGALTLSATWLEIVTGFLTNPTFPGAGIVVLPVLVVGFGLLVGTRATFAIAVVTIVTTIVTHRLSPAMVRTGFTTDSLFWFVMFAVAVAAAWAMVAFGLSGFTRVYHIMIASRQDLADTIRFAPDGILVVNSANRVLLLNPAAEALIGQPAAQIIDREISDVLGGAALSPDQLLRLADHGSGTVVELQLAPHAAHDAAPEHVEATWHAMEGGRRQLLLRNVSQRVRADEQRRAMEM